ncbi:MAG: hypothetical protein IJQ00_12390 [Kiritimatiellae bacterium]|nr:hypothetical protein [Kiritimatiellia bacterium]
MNDPNVSALSVASPSGSEKESLPPWFGFAAPHIRVTPGMKHDMESIRESIGRGIAAEMAARERRGAEER